MKEEFITAIEAETEKLKKDILQDAHADWIQLYSRMDLTPTQAAKLARKYVLHQLIGKLYLESSKTNATIE